MGQYSRLCIKLYPERIGTHKRTDCGRIYGSKPKAKWETIPRIQDDSKPRIKKIISTKDFYMQKAKSEWWKPVVIGLVMGIIIGIGI